jgi:hypothetical protein
VYCARAWWGLAVVYLALPFAFGIRAGAEAFAAFLFGAVIIAVGGLLLYGSSKRAARPSEGRFGAYLLRWVAGAGWLAFFLLVLAAVGLIVERLAK